MRILLRKVRPLLQDKVKFRLSRAGDCTRQLVLSVLQPNFLKPSEGKEEFLKTGHYLQPQVSYFVSRNQERFNCVPSKEEFEGIIEFDDFYFCGHVDNILFDSASEEYVLLEIKCIKDKSFNKLCKSIDWRDNYPSYVSQAQGYMGCKAFTSPSSKRRIEGPITTTYLVFMNRDNSKMVGGIPITHEGYEWREDMVEYYDPAIFESLVLKHQEAYTDIVNNIVPEVCNKEGWCFSCQRAIPKSGVLWEY